MEKPNKDDLELAVGICEKYADWLRQDGLESNADDVQKVADWMALEE